MGIMSLLSLIVGIISLLSVFIVIIARAVTPHGYHQNSGVPCGSRLPIVSFHCYSSLCCYSRWIKVVVFPVGIMRVMLLSVGHIRLFLLFRVVQENCYYS
jgi:hypothetical protein